MNDNVISITLHKGRVNDIYNHNWLMDNNVVFIKTIDSSFLLNKENGRSKYICNNQMILNESDHQNIPDNTIDIKKQDIERHDYKFLKSGTINIPTYESYNTENINIMECTILTNPIITQLTNGPDPYCSLQTTKNNWISYKKQAITKWKPVKPTKSAYFT
jgi:hypothetical protein